MKGVILNKLWFSRRYPYCVVFVPRRVFGCGLTDFRVERGLSHLTALLD